MIYSLDQQNEIWKFYFLNYDLSIPHKNPLRTDKTPKCYFRERDNNILFIDWANNPTHLNCIKFVSQMFNMSDLDAIRRINVDLKYTDKLKGSFDLLCNAKEVEKPLSIINKIEKEPPIYSANHRLTFNDYELDYWNSFHITEKTLNKFEVKPIDWVFRDGVLNYSASKHNPIFGYFDNNLLYKIYNPLGNKIFKWRALKAILEGYSKLEYNSNVVFVTSSLKDTMCLNEVGFNSFNMSSENSYKMLLPVIEDLYNKYEHIYLFLNNDAPGKKFSLLLTTEIDKRLKYINNPSMYWETDPSDLIKNHGKDLLKEIIFEKFKRDNVIWK
jgi:hypothetical protein